MTEVKSILVEIPLVKKNDPTKIVAKLNKNVPIPPSYQLSQGKTFDKKLEMEEDKQIDKIIQNYVETQRVEGVDKRQWTALAMKRNPEFLFLWERARSITKKGSFSKYETKNGYFRNNLT